MKSYQHILVPIDGSDHSKQALQQGPYIVGGRHAADRLTGGHALDTAACGDLRRRGGGGYRPLHVQGGKEFVLCKHP